MIPTRPQINSFNFAPLGDGTKLVAALANGVEKDAKNIESAISGLDWSGKAAKSADDRADRERRQRLRVAQAFDELAASIDNGRKLMPDIADRLKAGAADYEDIGYDVGDDWTVVDGYNYGLADAFARDDPAAQQRLADLKARRANEARSATTRLKRLAIDFQTADQNCAKAITDAISSLGSLAPVSAALSPNAAQQIVNALKSGTPLSQLQLEQLRAATNLSGEQTGHLQHGQVVTISQGQHGFLRTLMDGLDGMSVADITDLGVGGQHQQVQSALGNAVQLSSAPKIRTGAGDRGGMFLLPSDIRTTLTTNLVGKSDMHGVPEIRRWKDYVALGELLKSSNPQYRMGTDFDRGMLKQTAEISRAISGTDDDSIRASKYGIALTRSMSSSLSALSHDPSALHDFVTGDNMNVTCDNGGKYNATSHLTDLLSKSWGSGFDLTTPGPPEAVSRTGIDDLLGTMRTQINSENHFIAGLSRDSADHFGHYLVSDEGFEANHNLGARSPHLLRTISEAMSPYLGGFSDAPFGPRGVETYGVEHMTGDQMDRLFQVMDGDAESARIFNKSAMNWQNHMAYISGLHGDSSLGYSAGLLNQSMLDGYSNGLDTQTREALDNQEKQYQSMVNAYDIATSLGAEAAGAWNPALGTGVSILAPASTELLFGPAPTVDTVTTPTIDELKHLKIGEMTNSEMTTMSFYAGAIDANPRIDKFNPDWLTDGKLDFDKIAGSETMRKEWRDFSAGPLDDKWDDNWNHGTAASGGIPPSIDDPRKGPDE